LVLGAQGRRALDPIQQRHWAAAVSGTSFNRPLNNLQTWDINRYGGVDNGNYTGHSAGYYSFSGAQSILVNGSTYNQSSYLLGQDNQSLVMPVQSIGALQVSRKVYAPAGKSYARFLSLVENPTDQAVSTKFELRGYFYNSRPVVMTSSGD